MTERVDFYVLAGSSSAQRLTYACRLTEKAYLRDMRVVIVTDSDAETTALDELLWTFDEQSFIPHERGHGAGGASDAVQLTQDPDAVAAADLLVNLGSRLPARWQRFARIAEIIDADEQRRRLGRERYKAYRDLKVTLQTHQPDGATAV